MNRRGFVGSVLAGLGAFVLFPLNKLKANDNKLKNKQWWIERDIVIDGFPGKFYEWPDDRFVCFQKRKDDIAYIRTWGKVCYDQIYDSDMILLPAFSLRKSKSQDIIKAAKETIEHVLCDRTIKKDSLFVSIVKINNRKDTYAISVTEWPTCPATNLYPSER